MNRSLIGWVRWHAVELGAVTLPTVAAVTMHPAWAVLSAGTGAWWALLEVRAHRDLPPSPGGDRRDAPTDRGGRERDGASA